MRLRPIVIAVGFVGLAASCSLSADRRAQTPTSRAPRSTTTRVTSSPTTTTTGPPVTYRVRQGDTLSAIAARFGVATSAIVAASHLTNPDMLREGQVLHIPPAPPLALAVTPHQGPAGQGFRLELTGAKPSETVTFTIVSATGRYTGDPHTTLDGTVNVTYQTAVGDPAGIRTVIVLGNMGTHAQAQFAVVGSPSNTAP